MAAGTFAYRLRYYKKRLSTYQICDFSFGFAPREFCRSLKFSGDRAHFYRGTAPGTFFLKGTASSIATFSHSVCWIIGEWRKCTPDQ